MKQFAIYNENMDLIEVVTACSKKEAESMTTVKTIIVMATGVTL